MLKRTIYLLTLLSLVFACVKPQAEDDPQPVVPDDPQEQQDDPGDDNGQEEGGEEQETPQGKPRYVWIDASANFHYYANDKAYIAKEVQKIADCGFTDIIVDVRPTEGTVLWKSSVAPEARRLAAWVNGSYQFVEREATFDFLQAFIDSGHAAGLGVHAAINTFVCGCGGYYGLESEGPIFTGDIPESWAAVDVTSDGLQSSYYPGVEGTVFMNPASDEVQAYILSLLKELAAYDIEGIVLDRCRYDDTGLESEFSDVSKQKFTEYLGREPKAWPMFEAGAGTSTILGEEQKSWLAFRAKVIHDFIVKAADAVHGVNPEVKFGVYVGAWYSTYYTSGVNWASPNYNPYPGYKWANSDYHNYGYADHCDYMFLGCYAALSSIYGSGEWTMQGFAKRGRELLKGDTVFAGGPDIGNSTGWTSGGRSAYIPKTVDAIINEADGYFVFDLCHIREFEYWSAFKKAFTEYINTLTN